MGLRGSTDNFYRNRDDSGNVKLNRRNNAQGPRGTYVCVVLDSRGNSMRLVMQVYSPEGINNHYWRHLYISTLS